MPWKKGKIRFDDGSTYNAELLVNSDGEVWNARVFKNDATIEEIDIQKFAHGLNKPIEDVYPYTYEIDD
ncbi:hypothetical protein LGK97_08325 [Clostridium sp. CS001]|uniref:hypothetical protein n=1 Tax=Clostridium sp. CS001 TaxID=2880648 RepID=UPI001CF5F16E|nr:hypothetical protein [Clostridium sp. CS001]MCB2289770.1 hypothetical protein [Clostridium sp. CS001]